MSFERFCELGRRAAAQRSWAVARDAFADADAAGNLAAEDLESWGLAAHLSGHDQEADAVRERAHLAYLAAGDADGAARAAFWLALALVLRGELARGRGWFGRMRSVCDDAGLADCVWRGYALLNQGMEARFSGELSTSLALLDEASEIADRFGDQDLQVLIGNGRGHVLLAIGDFEAGMTILDEVMVRATTGSVSPQVAGLVYCAVIASCRQCLDVNRSREWTDLFSRWCDRQPGLVPYRGQCVVHRSELLQLRGQWDAAATEVEEVLNRLGNASPHVAIGMAFYQRGDLHRLRGEFDAAEQAYREALRSGHDPQPGLALLRLAQGRTATALVAIRRSLAEVTDRAARIPLLQAAVEIAIVAADLEYARDSAAEVEHAAEQLNSAFLRAASAASRGAVALAAGDATAALTLLRQSALGWQLVDAPYEAARCRELLAQACHALGDEETAELELEAARVTYGELGAKWDVDRLAARTAPPPSVAAARPAGLTGREIEVLGLVATGASNRDIAQSLFLSEKTVARHVANIFVKLDVSSRSAATAFAYENGIA